MNTDCQQSTCTSISVAMGILNSENIGISENADGLVLQQSIRSES
jgi:hypothetical protein